MKNVKEYPENFKPIDYTIAPGTHPSRYWIHKYPARKPMNVNRKYIEHFTKPGDIVLDPFCGSGVVPVEAVMLGRKAIGVDLNPVATFITRMTATSDLDIQALKQSFEQIKQNTKEKIDSLYATICPKCRKKATIISTVWWKSKSPTHIFVECPSCKFRGLRETTDGDIQAIEKVEKRAEKELSDYWYPKEKMPKSAPNIPLNKDTYVSDLFSKRNLLALSILYKEIQKTKNKTIRNLMKLTFTANLEPVSKLIPVRKSRLDKGVVPAGSWSFKGYWIPENRVEGHVFYYFEHRFRKTVRAVEDSIKEFKKRNIERKEGKSFNDLLKDKNILISDQSTTNLKELLELPDNSIDYILTDPPYAGAELYLDQSALWAFWLKYKLNYDDEIVINKRGGKLEKEYKEKLTKAFEEMHRVLKKNGYCSLWFHYKDPDIWFALLSSAEYAGFEKVSLAPQPPAKITGKQGGNPEGAITGDFIVTFKRLDKPRTDFYINSYGNVVNIEQLIVEETAKLLAGKLHGLNYGEIYNTLIQVMITRGLYHKVRQKVSKELIQRLLKSNFLEREGKWFFNENKEELLRLLSEDDLVKHYLASIVNSFGVNGASIDEIHTQLIPVLPRLQTTDPSKRRKKLEPLLKDIGAWQTVEGKWTLETREKQKEKKHVRKPLHEEVTYILYEIGRRCGYEVFISKNDQGKSYKGQRLGDLDVLTDLPDEISQSVTLNDRKFIEQIDTIWIGKKELYAFEIEFSTGITSGGQRLANLIDALLLWQVCGYVVILDRSKDEREARKKLGDRLFERYVKEKQLGYILYPSLVDIFKPISRYPDLEVDIERTIGNIVRSPSITSKARKLTEYK
jgi:16S rRNA G966 N2-methylase RsmD